MSAQSKFAIVRGERGNTHKRYICALKMDLRQDAACQRCLLVLTDFYSCLAGSANNASATTMRCCHGPGAQLYSASQALISDDPTPLATMC